MKNNPNIQDKQLQVILSQIIDIEEYCGLIHYTQIGNIDGSLMTGLTTSIKNRMNRTTNNQILPKRGGGAPQIDFGIIAKDSSFSEWRGMSWEYGPYALLINNNNIPENIFYSYTLQQHITDELKDYIKSNGFYMCDYPHHGFMVFNDENSIPAPPQRDIYLSEISSAILLNKYLVKKKESIVHLLNLVDLISNLHHEFTSGLEINITKRKDDWYPYTSPNNAIMGIIINPEKNPIRRCKTHKDGEKTIFISPEMSTRYAIKTLNKLTDDPNTHLVPLYDNKGNILWPENIPYKEVQKIASKNLQTG